MATTTSPVNGDDLLSPQQQLFVAAKGGHTGDASDAITRRKIDVNTKDELGNTALHYASGGGHKETVSELLALGAEINAVNAVSDTPLHKAAGRGHKEVAAILVEAGADLYAVNELGQTPKDVANDPETAAELVEQVADELLEGIDVDSADHAVTADDDEIPIVEVEPNPSDPSPPIPQPRRPAPPPRKTK